MASHLQAAEGLEDKQKGDKVTIAIRPERFNFVAAGEESQYPGLYG